MARAYSTVVVLVLIMVRSSVFYIYISLCVLFSVADFEFCAFLCFLSSEARKHLSKASRPPAGTRNFKGPVEPLKF